MASSLETDLLIGTFTLFAYKIRLLRRIETLSMPQVSFYVILFSSKMCEKILLVNLVVSFIRTNIMLQILFSRSIYSNKAVNYIEFTLLLEKLNASTNIVQCSIILRLTIIMINFSIHACMPLLHLWC